jgi:hypothetical protein
LELVFLVPSVKQVQMVSLFFLFLFTAIACSFAAFAYAEFASMVPVSGSAYTYYMLLLANYSLDYRLGINHGILCRKYHCCYIVGDYFTGLLESGGLSYNGFKWISCPHLGI